MAWLKDQAPDNVYKMNVLFEDKDLPKHMRSKGYPYRSPKAYGSLYVYVFLQSTNSHIF